MKQYLYNVLNTVTLSDLVIGVIITLLMVSLWTILVPTGRTSSLPDEHRESCEGIAARLYPIALMCSKLTIKPAQGTTNTIELTYQLSNNPFTQVIVVPSTAAYMDYAYAMLERYEWNLTRNDQRINATPPAVPQPVLHQRAA